MITHLSLTDFKAFRDLDLELKPITLLLGPNNSGKSSIIAPLRLLAQTAQAQDPNISLLLDGPLGDFGTYRDIVHGNQRSRALKIGMAGVHEDTETKWNIDVEFAFRQKRRQLIVREVTLSARDDHLVTVHHNRNIDRHVITCLGGRTIASHRRTGPSDLVDLHQFIPFVYGRRALRRQQALPAPISSEELLALESRSDNVAFGIRDALFNIEYISAMRAPPERTYHQTGETRARIGAAGENWTGILVLDAARTGASSKQLMSRVSTWLANAGLAATVSLNWLSDRHYEVMIKHPVSGESENLADVGQANSQILPVLVGGYRLDAGSIYMVEEPEIHLHPHAQAQLGDFFVDLYRQGVASLVETHSEYLVLRVQQLVASGEIPAEQVAFYYVHADADRAEKCVLPLVLDREARFHPQLPGGFFPEHLDEARKLAKLRGQSGA